ncbi:MAG: molybdopterin molybdotransferase MoeA [Niabella sp.]
MITVHEAKALIAQNVKPLGFVQLPLQQALGKALAEDVFAMVDIPAFPQSAMDGYAFCFDGWKAERKLNVIGAVPAGDANERTLKLNEAVRIFTGAPVPDGADTVVMQENVKTEGGYLIIGDDKLQFSGNVRPKGSEIKKGALALPANTVLNAGAVGFLAGLGISVVKVYRFPVVSIIITGNELQQPGHPLSYGQVYESNSYGLVAALERVGITDIKVFMSGDYLDELSAKIQLALQISDIVLLTGGVSVGDYDFVIKASEICYVEKVFHKIKQRPGKPLFFGKKEDKVIFGLPGNPSSVLTCFYMYVLPALSKLSNKSFELKQVICPLKGNHVKHHQLVHFLKAYYDGETVEVLEAQESYRLRSFAYANCLVELDTNAKTYLAGELVKTHLLLQY